MLSSLKDLVAGLRKKVPPARRRLRVEPLESRTLLSATSMATLEFRPDPPLFDSAAGFFDADAMAHVLEARQELQREADTERSKVFEQIALSRAELADHRPLQAIRSTIESISPRLQVPANTHDQSEGAEYPARASTVPPDKSEFLERFNDLDRSRVLNQRRENFVGAPGIDVIAHRANLEMEGGFVGIGRGGSVPSPRLAGQFLTMRGQFATPGLFAFPGERMVLSYLPGLQSTPLESSLSNTLRTSPGTLMLDPLEASRATNLPSEGGFVTLAVHEPVVLTDSSVSFTQSDEVNELHTKPSFASGLDSAAHTSISRLDGIRSSMLEDGTEGGLVDIDIVNKISPPMSTRADYAPLLNPLWDYGTRNSVDSIWQNLGDEDESLGAPRVAGDEDQPTNQPSDGNGQWQDAARRFSSTFDSEEGGMIELVATAFTKAETGYASTLSLESTHPRPSSDGKNMRMDKGLGLFQAFELAAVPSLSADQSNSTMAGTNEPGPLVKTTASTLKDGAPAPEESASAVEKSGTLPDSHAAAMPAIVMASLLTAVDVGREKVTSRKCDRHIETI